MRRRKRETLINFPTDDVKCTKNYFWKGERGRKCRGAGGKIIEVQDLTLIHSTPTADFWFRWHLACMIDVMFFLTRSDRELISNFPLPQGINKLFIMRPKWRISRVSEIPWISRWSFSSRPTYFLFHEHTRISWSFAALFCFFGFLQLYRITCIVGASLKEPPCQGSTFFIWKWLYCRKYYWILARA